MKRNIEQNLNETIELNNIPFKIEGIFIDLDGTLLDKCSKKPSKKNIEAIKSLNIPIIISTGRSFSKKVKNIMELLGVEYVICQNGAVIANNKGQILKNITLNLKQINDSIELIKNNKLGFTINSQFLIYTNRWPWAICRLLDPKHWKKIKKYEPKDNYVNKIVVGVSLRKKKMWAVSDLLKAKLKNVSVNTSGRDKIIEITNEEATKGKAANYIASLLNINIKKCIHIGDSENDNSTYKYVGALIAMNDASTKLLDIVKYVGPNHKNGGVAKLLNGEIKTK